MKKETKDLIVIMSWLFILLYAVSADLFFTWVGRDAEWRICAVCLDLVIGIASCRFLFVMKKKETKYFIVIMSLMFIPLYAASVDLFFTWVGRDTKWGIYEMCFEPALGLAYSPYAYGYIKSWLGGDKKIKRRSKVHKKT